MRCSSVQGFWIMLTICVCINLCKRSQREADAVLRTGETHVPQKGRQNEVLIRGIHAERRQFLETRGGKKKQINVMNQRRHLNPLPTPNSHMRQARKGPTLPNSILKEAAACLPSECQGQYHVITLNFKRFMCTKETLVCKETVKDPELQSQQHKCFVLFVRQSFSSPKRQQQSWSTKQGK